MSVATSTTKTYCIIQGITGAYYFEWLGQRAVDRLVADRFAVEAREFIEHDLAVVEDIITDISFMLAHASFSSTQDEAWGNDDEAQAYAMAVRETLGIICESIGQDIHQSPTPAVYKVLEMFTKRAVHRLQFAFLEAAKVAI